VARYAPSRPSNSPLADFASAAAELLAKADPVVHDALCAEQGRQEQFLLLTSTGIVTDPALLACLGSTAVNVVGAGQRGIGRLALDRARKVFRTADALFLAESPANVGRLLAGVLPGHPVVEISSPGRDAAEVVTERVRERAPCVVLARPEPWPRVLDHGWLRDLVAETGSFLIADVSDASRLALTTRRDQILGHAHVTLLGPRHQLGGPPGCLVLFDPDEGHGGGTVGALVHDTLADRGEPPDLAAWAALACCLGLADTAAVRAESARTLRNARTLAAELDARGVPVVSGGTDTHLVMLDLPTGEGASPGLCRRALAEVGVIVDCLPGSGGLMRGDDLPRAPQQPDGGPAQALVLGTVPVTRRGFGEGEMRQIAETVVLVAGAVRARPAGQEGEYELNGQVRERARDTVRRLVSRFPLPDHLTVGRGGRGR